jgi:predicted CXXCH cytochrome family protein
MRRTRICALAAVAAAFVLCRLQPAMGAEQPSGRPTADGYAGSHACQRCHPSQFSSWSGSLHAAAMRELAKGEPPAAILADGSTTAFGKNRSASVAIRCTKDQCRAEVKEGEAPAQTFEVAAALGRRPMEQLLVSTGKGRLQALPVAFDTAAAEGFDLFSGEERLPGDYGHWRGRGMNANSQCIECHTTFYRKGYDAESDSYASAWAEAGVGCEACHGAAAAHVADPSMPLGPFGAGTPIANFRPSPKPAGSEAADRLSPPPGSAVMQEVCATCHSVRRTLAEGFVPGARLLDHFEPVLLDEDNFWPDGQVRTESYEWSSYQQSRMHARGVSCLACHDVHSGGLREQGDALCLSCHEANLASKEHTAHAADSAGSRCVSCHMPGSVFMARDRRLDHSLSVPDPLSARDNGHPSACESCHASKGRAVLAEDALRLWPGLSGARFVRRRQVTRAFADGRRGDAKAGPVLADCLSGKLCDTPVLRASAARLMAGLEQTQAAQGAWTQALGDSDPMVRSAAAFALAEAGTGDAEVERALVAAAGDPVRAVRSNAAFGLRHSDRTKLSPAQSAALADALGQWRETARLLADSPETQHALGLLEAGQNRLPEAEAALRRAVAIEPRAVPARYDLAMLLAGAGRVEDARRELEALVARDDRFAPAWYALGMIHGEQKRWSESAEALGRCLKLDRDYPDVLLDLTRAYLEAGVPNMARSVAAAAAEYPPLREQALEAQRLIDARP